MHMCSIIVKVSNCLDMIIITRWQGFYTPVLILSSVAYYRHDGLIILATNRPYDLDEAMHRRIIVAIEFGQPDHLLRKAIWESHIPSQMKLKDDIDLVC